MRIARSDIMEWQRVSSSNLARVRYDEDTNTLEIEFHGGNQYQYFDVPKRIYEELISAASKGGYFHKQIKGHYRYAKK